MVDRIPLCRVCHIAYDACGMTGKTHSAESRAKMSRSRTGRVMPAEMRQRLSVAMTGRAQTPEHVKNNSAARRGQKQSPEARQRMREAALRRLAREREEANVDGPVSPRA
jgi:hypothetical protein